MLLAVDIGNTNIVIGLLGPADEAGTRRPRPEVSKVTRPIIATYRITTAAAHTSDEYGIMLLQFLALSSCKPADVEGVIISNVVPSLMHSFRAAIIKFFGLNPLVVGPGVKTGLSVRIDDPRSLGADCLVDCVAAYNLYPAPCLVIDMGTATTFNIVDDHGAITMGLITAGLQTSAKALAGETAQLPQVEIRKPSTILTRNTGEAIQAGLYYSFLGGLETIVKQISSEYEAQRPDSPKLTVVATGGLGRVVEEDATALGILDAYDPDLIFKGLDIIYSKTARY